MLCNIAFIHFKAIGTSFCPSFVVVIPQVLLLVTINDLIEEEEFDTIMQNKVYGANLY